MKEKIKKDEDLAVFLRALGHNVRLDILRIIADDCKNQCCCTDVAKCFDLAQSTVSQHIKVLLEAGLVIKQAKGVRNCYLVNFDKLNQMQGLYNEYLSTLSGQNKGSKGDDVE